MTKLLRACQIDVLLVIYFQKTWHKLDAPCNQCKELWYCGVCVWQGTSPGSCNLFLCGLLPNVDLFHGSLHQASSKAPQDLSIAADPPAYSDLVCRVFGLSRSQSLSEAFQAVEARCTSTCAATLAAAGIERPDNPFFIKTIVADMSSEEVSAKLHFQVI